MKRFLLVLFSFFVLAASGQVNTTSLLDTTYSHDGYWINGLNISQGVQCEDVKNDGTYVALYIENTLALNSSYIVKYTPEGYIDTAFGNSGVVIISGQDFLAYTDSTPYFYAKELRILPNNKILLQGRVDSPVSQSEVFSKIVVCRFNEDGSWDSTFANGGIYVTGFQNNVSFSPQKLVICSNGDVLALGNIGNYLNKKRTLFRLNEDGVLDTTFNHFGHRNFSNVYSITLFENPNSEIVMPYWSNLNGGNFRTLKISETGDSISANVSAPDVDVYISNIFMDKQGRIYYSGFESGTGNDHSLYILRTNTDLAYDSLFGNNGMVTITDPYYNLVRHNLNFTNDALFSSTIAYKSYNFWPDTFYVESYALTTKLNLDGSRSADFGLNGQYYLKLPYRMNNNQEPYIYPILDGLIVTGGQEIYNPDSLRNFYNFFAAKLFADTVTLIPLGLIDNPTITQSILAYPNPIQNGVLNLSYELNNKQDVAVDLYDIKGQLITRLMPQQTRVNGKNTETLMLPQSLSAGQYILRITAGNYQKGVSVVVN